jgi:hypothetical protein
MFLNVNFLLFFFCNFYFTPAYPVFRTDNHNVLERAEILRSQNPTLIFCRTPDKYVCFFRDFKTRNVNLPKKFLMPVDKRMFE